eukprot:TRINITY_DN22933_c0_g1_i1.p1 TRINITY_DN22933_c0_g1~~TRINITY_DN22933_c0_g1_i1.p1  ORF type:complete len:318 (+),score=25.71 TRINITY_DN22933_c0_g1_i1:73-1026(+)
MCRLWLVLFLVLGDWTLTEACGTGEEVCDNGVCVPNKACCNAESSSPELCCSNVNPGEVCVTFIMRGERKWSTFPTRCHLQYGALNSWLLDGYVIESTAFGACMERQSTCDDTTTQPRCVISEMGMLSQMQQANTECELDQLTQKLDAEGRQYVVTVGLCRMAGAVGNSSQSAAACASGQSFQCVEVTLGQLVKMFETQNKCQYNNLIARFEATGHSFTVTEGHCPVDKAWNQCVNADTVYSLGDQWNTTDGEHCNRCACGLQGVYCSQGSCSGAPVLYPLWCLDEQGSPVTEWRNQCGAQCECVKGKDKCGVCADS